MTIGLDTTFLIQHDTQGAPFHDWARKYLRTQAIDKGHALGLCPQVLVEYIHVITDSNRFEHPLQVSEAIARTEIWWALAGVHKVLPTERSVILFLEWMKRHRLGRKRVLDTLLASTYASNGFHSILTTDATGFEVFQDITVLKPESL
jgi:predicted nucleic acid-binding protein